MMRTTTPILSILIAILLFVFFTHPQYVEIADIEKEIAQYNDAKTTTDTFTQKLTAKLAKKAERSAVEVERLDQLVPSSIDGTRHLVDLEALAGKHNLLFGNTSVEDSDLVTTKSTANDSEKMTRDELLTVDISFDVVGTYAQLKSFLQDLERSLTLFEVTELSFNVVEGQFQQFSFTVRTYALPENN